MDVLQQIGKRLAEFLKYKNLGVNELGRMTGTSGAQISFIIKGNKYGIDKMINILNTYPDLNPLWILFSEGEMLKSSPTGENPRISGNFSSFEIQKLSSEIARLESEIENLKNINSVKDKLIDNLNSTVDVLRSTNNDLKELLNHYKGNLS